MIIYEVKMCDFEDIRDDPQSVNFGATLFKTYQDAWEWLHTEFTSHYDDSDEVSLDDAPLFKMKPFESTEALYGSTIKRFYEFNDDGILYTIYEHDLEEFMS